MWSNGQSPWLQIQTSGFNSRSYLIIWEVVGLERGQLSLKFFRLFLLYYLNDWISLIKICMYIMPPDSLCGLVVRVPGYRSRGPGSIPGATKLSEK
jgi:hypothetical protein